MQTEYSLFKFVNCSSFFRLVPHPSPGAHNTVYTVTGINETAKDTTNYYKCLSYIICYSIEWFFKNLVALVI